MNERKNIYEVINKWEKSSFFIDDLLSSKEISDFSYRIIKGIVEKKLFLEYVIKSYLNRNVSRKTMVVLKIAFYELLFNDSSKSYATVNEAVNMAKNVYPKDKNLVNAVLRSFLRSDKKYRLPEDRKKYLSINYSYPISLIDILLNSYNLDSIERLFKYFDKQNYLDIRVNTNLIEKKEYIEKLENQGINFKLSDNLLFHIRILDDIKVPELVGYNEGWFYVQDKAAQIISQLVYPLKGDVLDVGSAPGGKLTFFSQINPKNFSLFGVESSKRRLKRLQQNIIKLKAKNIEVINKNFLEFNPDRNFRHIFLDPPCSGLGVIGKKADIKYRITTNDIKSLRNLQRKLLNHASSLIDKEGEIIYSTCTLNKNENETIIKNFLKDNKSFEIKDIKSKKYLKNYLNNDTLKEQKIIKTFPPSDDMDGMFACVLRKRR